MVTLTIAPPGPMLLREAGSRRGRLQGTDGRMINRRTGSGKRARNPAGSRFKPGEPNLLGAQAAARRAGCPTDSATMSVALTSAPRSPPDASLRVAGGLLGDAGPLSGQAIATGPVSPVIHAR